MIIPKLAFRNLIGNGTKTWLNALVLSFSFVAIIWGQSLFEGMDKEMSKVTIDQEAGGGQYWAGAFDPFDPMTIDDAPKTIPAELAVETSSGRAAPILIVSGTIYPKGRMVPALLKGVDPDQAVLKLPFDRLRGAAGDIPGLIGARMAKNTGLSKGDTVTVRWRDASGTFDAADIEIVEIFQTQVQTVDVGQIWIPLKALQGMTGRTGKATIVTMPAGTAPRTYPEWSFQGHDVLLKDIKNFVQAKSVGFSIFYLTLMAMALLAIFNTQILSIWHRRREIGTLIALGMPRGRVIRLFTLEGTMLSLLAAAVGAVYGLPLLIYMAKHGWVLPAGQADSFGLALNQALYPAYSAGLVIVTILIVLAATTVVSFLPTRKIVTLKPTDALKGKWS
ncbi:MAG: FtsX-like permease family protein [Candidatus Aminicenantes bacterium]|nr:FtsX-like permease family protein [Candidatus Aminicenantes bacterium]